ncbi:unnamed protein product [Paramecium sonneborni]|uniref:Uncharacterized protein n=1 Tax=Paramecium sonneborni TaxID=65129 RepID=A0A8S1LRZ5_9CILI|nr:unnamed protein product [Paramecium sonneborni]
MNFRIAILLFLVCGVSSVLGELVVVSKSFQGNPIKEAEGWAVVGAPSLITECGGTFMFGGFRVFGSRTTVSKVFQLPPHSLINIKVQFWKIDSWDNEEAYIFVDDQLAWSRKFQVNEGDGQKCGQGGDWREMTLNLDLNVRHTGTTAIVLFTSDLNEAPDNESWAIRDFVISIEKCPDGCSACQFDDKTENCSFWQSFSSSWGALQSNLLGADGWEVTGGQTSSSDCGGVALYGGYQKMGGRFIVSKILKINPHYKLKIKVLWAKIDSWDNEAAQIKVDGNMVWERNFQWYEGYSGKICGSPVYAQKAFFARTEVDIVHTGDQVKIEFTTTLDEDVNNESFGLRDFNIYYAACSKNCAECTGPKDSDCKKCANNWALVEGKCQALPSFFVLEQSFLEDKFTGINGWTITSKVPAGKEIGECGGKSLVGGFGIFGVDASASKTFQVPSHRRLKLQTTFYKIDSWDEEFMIIQVDGVEIKRFFWNLQTGGANICGQGIWFDGIIPFEQILFHSTPQVSILFTSTLNQEAGDESWGFRDFKLFYEPLEACAIVYSECFFKGKKTEICSKSPNFLKDKIPLQSKSIRIPPQGRLTLFEKNDYNGKKVTFTEDQTCLDNFDFSLIHLSGQVEGGWVEVEQ